MIKKQTFEKFLDELGSKSPTPGGGAVAAMSGAMSASLVEMVANLTKDGSLKKVGQRAGLLKSKFLKLADEDVDAFNAVMKNWKTAKKKASLKRAMQVPQETAILSKEVQKLATIATKKGNKNAYSDAKSALYLAKAAYASAIENVKINKKALKNI